MAPETEKKKLKSVKINLIEECEKDDDNNNNHNDFQI